MSHFFNYHYEIRQACGCNVLHGCLKCKELEVFNFGYQFKTGQTMYHHVPMLCIGTCVGTFCVPRRRASPHEFPRGVWELEFIGHPVLSW